MVSAVLTRDLRLIRLVVHYMLEDERDPTFTHTPLPL